MVPTPDGDLVVVAGGSDIHVEAPAGVRTVVLKETTSTG